MDQEVTATPTQAMALPTPTSALPPRPPAPTTSSRPPVFPTLEASILDADGTYRPLPINSRDPVPIDTPLFKGHVLLLVRPETEADDPYYSEQVFRGKRRRFEVQIQGRFKVATDNAVVYTGGEVTIKQMQLGLLTRGVARGLLSLISAVLPIHYSFGQPTTSRGVTQPELPHIVSPLMISADRMVVTPQGQLPPSLGAPGMCDLATLEKDPERKARRADAGQRNNYGQFDTSSTYTFSFNTSNVDLPTWQLRGLPLWGDLDLRSFWDNGALRIVAYRHRQASESLKASAPHNPSPEDYAFVIQIQAVDPATRLQRGARMEDISIEVAKSPVAETPRAGPVNEREVRDDSPTLIARTGSDDDSSDDQEDDGIDRASCASYKTAAEFIDADALTPTAAELSPSSLSLPSMPETAPAYLCGGAGSIPARVEVVARGGSHTTMLLVAVDGTSLIMAHSALVRLLPRALWRACVAASEGWGWSPRLLAAERQRRLVGR